MHPFETRAMLARYQRTAPGANARLETCPISQLNTGPRGEREFRWSKRKDGADLLPQL